MDSRNLPTRHTSLDRTAFERVLARAMELQTAGGEAMEQLSEQQLIEIGQEVGLSPLHVKQALAEERTRVAVPDEGRVGSFFGATHIAAQRMVRVPSPSAMQRLERWMDKEEALQIKRRSLERTTWEARRDFLGSVKRGFNVGGRGYALSSANEVGATTTQVDPQSTLVALAADYTAARQRSMWGTAGLLASVCVVGAGLVTVAVLASGSLLVAGAGCAILAAVGVGGTFSIARANKKLVARGQLALEQALDRMEENVEPPASVLGSLLDAAVREFKQ